MKNASQKKRIAARDAEICKDYAAMKRKHLDSDYIIKQLSETYYLSERWIWIIVRAYMKNKQSAKAKATAN